MQKRQTYFFPALMILAIVIIYSDLCSPALHTHLMFQFWLNKIINSQILYIYIYIQLEKKEEHEIVFVLKITCRFFCDTLIENTEILN